MRPRYLSVLLLSCLLRLAQADAVQLVPVSGLWHYRLAKGLPSPPTPADWATPGFIDASWQAARGGFCFDSGAATTTLIGDYPDDFLSVCLRTQFALDAAADSPSSVALRVDYSGGFVAYLNGIEVARRGVGGTPGVPVAFDQPAAPHARGTPEIVDLSGARDILRPGVNTLAVQWNLSLPVPYGAAFVPELLANFARGPFLQDLGRDHVKVLWQSLQPATPVLEYGESRELGNVVETSSTGTNFSLRIDSLKAGAVYYYRAGSRTSSGTAWSPVYDFKTFAATGPVTFIATADVGGGTMGQYGLADTILSQKPDLVLLAGDLFYPALNTQMVDQHFFSVYARSMHSIPFYPAVGNHDILYGDPNYFFTIFDPPTNNLTAEAHAIGHTGPKNFYSFDAGDVHFVALFVPLMQEPYTLKADSPQLLWLDSDLAATTKPWKVLFLHHPVFSSSIHSDDDYDENGETDILDLQRLLLPIAQRHGVRLIVSGHEHVFERFTPANGVYSVITGGGGGSLYPPQQLDPSNSRFTSRYECVRFRIDGPEMRVDGLDASGRVFDSMFVRLAPPAGTNYTAAWNSPVVETSPSDDGYGNIWGQKLDFLGEPIPSTGGDYANLGRLWVNCDATNLYLGLEQLTMNRSNSVFLFIETPGSKGVSTMAGVGNGRIDPLGEGADGLDCLENLSFTNFHPGFACILGDEYADGTFRSWPMTNHMWSGSWYIVTNIALNTGQGAFRLEPGLPAIQGARVQQYNYSPQIDPWGWEHVANFAEAALPLASIGLLPGQSIRVGVVAGGDQFSASLQTRALTSAFIGRSLSDADVGGARALEGIEVVLAPDPDADHDGLSAEEENLFGTDPNNPDTDGDGLPDGWETRYGLNPLSGSGVDGAQGDPDNDGVPNLLEFQLSLDPRAPQPSFKARVILTGSGGAELSWISIPGRRYELLWTPDLSRPFEPLVLTGLPRLATSFSEKVVLSPSERLGLAGFFRVRQLP